MRILIGKYLIKTKSKLDYVYNGYGYMIKIMLWKWTLKEEEEEEEEEMVECDWVKYWGLLVCAWIMWEIRSSGVEDQGGRSQWARKKTRKKKKIMFLKKNKNRFFKFCSKCYRTFFSANRLSSNKTTYIFPMLRELRKNLIFRSFGDYYAR